MTSKTCIITIVVLVRASLLTLFRFRNQTNNIESINEDIQ